MPSPRYLALGRGDQGVRERLDDRKDRGERHRTSWHLSPYVQMRGAYPQAQVEVERVRGRVWVCHRSIAHRVIKGLSKSKPNRRGFSQMTAAEKM
jgi:hypothetical protein